MLLVKKKNLKSCGLRQELGVNLKTEKTSIRGAYKRSLIWNLTLLWRQIGHRFENERQSEAGVDLSPTYKYKTIFNRSLSYAGYIYSDGKDVCPFVRLFFLLSHFCFPQLLWTACHNFVKLSQNFTYMKLFFNLYFIYLTEWCLGFILGKHGLCHLCTLKHTHG